MSVGCTYLPNGVELEVLRSNGAVALATGTAGQANITLNERAVEGVDVPAVTLAVVTEIMDGAQATTTDGQKLGLVLGSIIEIPHKNGCYC